MASKSTSFFTDCVSGVSPLKEMPDVLLPIEKDVLQFFDDLKNKRVIDQNKLTDCKTILSDLISNELLPSGNSVSLGQHAKDLQRQIVAIEYALRNPSFDVEGYLRLVKINQKKPVVRTESQFKQSKKVLPIDEAQCMIFLKSTQAKIQEFHHLLKPLEVQPPLSMVIPPFEEESEVYSYVTPFEARAERAVWLNNLKGELSELSRGLKKYEGVFDPMLKRLRDQCLQGVLSLSKRIVVLRSDFTQRPTTSKEALAVARASKDSLFHSPRTPGIFSQKPGNLTLS
ncbi:MAG: hypothetical protein SFW07_02000 [Gammaproteobacteria bacterium]|nr:hypothetical protein [Gammaproteobacteria bacterium]